MGIKRTSPFVDNRVEQPDLSWSALDRAFYAGREHLRERHSRRFPSSCPPIDEATRLAAAMRAVGKVQEQYGDACVVRITLSNPEPAKE